MNYVNFVAQLDDLKPWFQSGLAGLVIWWLINKQDTAMKELRQAIVESKEAQTQSATRIEHKITGLNRTLLINLLSQENLSFQAKKMAEAELEKNGGGHRAQFD